MSSIIRFNVIEYYECSLDEFCLRTCPEEEAVLIGEAPIHELQFVFSPAMHNEEVVAVEMNGDREPPYRYASVEVFAKDLLIKTLLAQLEANAEYASEGYRGVIDLHVEQSENAVWTLEGEVIRSLEPIITNGEIGFRLVDHKLEPLAKAA